jgi:hypothetical protein
MGTTTKTLLQVSHSGALHARLSRFDGHCADDRVATEPFDEILDRRIWGLNTEKVGWDTAIAERRKKTPADIYLLEEDLEKRKTAAEWLPEGEDDVAG